MGRTISLKKVRTGLSTVLAQQSAVESQEVASVPSPPPLGRTPTKHTALIRAICVHPQSPHWRDSRSPLHA